MLWQFTIVRTVLLTEEATITAMLMRQKILIFFLGALVGVLGSQVGNFLGESSPFERVAASQSFQSLESLRQPILSQVGVVNGDPAVNVTSEVKSVRMHEVLPSIVRVNSETMAGSGVIIDPKGTVLTSAHLLIGMDRVQVEVDDNRWLEAKVIQVDEKRDLALIALPPGTYVAASLGQSEEILPGSPVTVVGYPLNLPGWASMTRGIVSRVFTDLGTDRTLIQTDAAVNLGNSGGPILNDRGEIIGIISSIVGEYNSLPATGISYAVSINTIREAFLLGIGNER